MCFQSLDVYQQGFGFLTILITREICKSHGEDEAMVEKVSVI